ncbi:hypothetical protein CALCODRAFT_512607 [Calocera cornea HHB12733]|uniref:Uncharacterized protein n=1 Tax=Calocera cornea HHB12733 TaxID=1353952 RepID=A0A165CX02_9BASI|nr:hypothetical protein CALCODRAFT_512607 [Calocera cornea HHB12733]
MPPSSSSAPRSYPQSRIPISPTTPVPILIPSLRVTAPTPGQTPKASFNEDGTMPPPTAAPRAKSVKSVRIQEPEPRMTLEMIAERGERQRMKQLEGQADRSRVAPWAEPDHPSRAPAATLKKKSKENKKDVISTLSGFRVAIDPSPPLPELVSQPRPLSRNASVRAPLAAAQERTRVDSKATLLSFKSNRSATSAKTTSSIATTASTATTSTTASAHSAVSHTSNASIASRSSASQYSTIRDASSSKSKRGDGLEHKRSRSRLGLDSLFHAWGPSKDASKDIPQAVAPEVKEKSLWARTIGRKSVDKERARSPTPSSIGRNSGDIRRSMETERARSPTPSMFSGRSQLPRPISPPLGHPTVPESIAAMLETASRAGTPTFLAPPSSQTDLSASETDDNKEDTHGPRFMRSIRSIATFRQKQAARERGQSTSSGSSWEAGAPSEANSPAKPAVDSSSPKTSLEPEVTVPHTSTATVNSIKDVGDGTIRGMASIFGLRSVSRASNHSDSQRVRKSRSSTGTFDSVSSRDVTSLPPHLHRPDYPTPPISQLQAAAADVPNITRVGSKMRRPGLQGLFDGMKKHKPEKSQEEKKALHESWVEIERPSFECNDDGRELIALAMPFSLPPATAEELEQIARTRSQSPPPSNVNNNLPDLLDPTPKNSLRLKTKQDQNKQSSLRGSLRRVFQPETQRTPRKSQRPMSDGDMFEFMRGPVNGKNIPKFEGTVLMTFLDFSALAAANSELSDLISSLDLTGVTPDCTPAKPSRFFSARPIPLPTSATVPAVPNSAHADLVTPKTHSKSIQEESGASSLPTPVSAEGGFHKAHKAQLPSMSTLRGRQLKSLSATAREEWLSLFPDAMGAATAVDISSLTPDATPTLDKAEMWPNPQLKKIDFAKAALEPAQMPSEEAPALSSTVDFTVDATHAIIEPAKTNSMLSVPESYKDWINSLRGSEASISLSASTLGVIAGNYLAFTGQGSHPSDSTSTASIYESAQESLSKTNDSLPKATEKDLKDIANEMSPHRARSPPPSMPLPPTPDGDMSFSLIVPGGLSSKVRQLLPDINTTLTTLDRPISMTSDDMSPLSRKSSGSERSLDFTETYNQLAGPGIRKSFVNYVAHVSEEMFGNQEYLSSVLNLSDSALPTRDMFEFDAVTAHKDKTTLADDHQEAPARSRKGHVPADSYASLPSMYDDQLPGNSMIFNVTAPSALHHMASILSDGGSKLVARYNDSVAFPPSESNRDSYSTYDSSALDADIAELSAQDKMRKKRDTETSIPSISSYGALVKPGVPNPMGYTASERARLDSESSIRPLTASAMAAMDDDQLRRRFNRQSSDSVASTWSFHPQAIPLQYRTHGHVEAPSGPPPAYLNNNKRNSLMRNRDSMDSQSAAQAYQMYGSIGGIAASAGSRRDSQDSILTGLSEMSPMSYQRRGRPGIADDKMFESAGASGMLDSIVDASEADLSSRASFDSEMLSSSARESDDELHSDEDDSLFPAEGKRFKENGRDKLALPALFRGKGRKPRPVSAISQDSVYMPGPDDTMMTMLDGDMGWARRSGIQNSPSVHAALNRHAKANDHDQVSTQVRGASVDPAHDLTQTIKFSERRAIKVLETLRPDDSIDNVVLKASGLSDHLPPTPRITKPAPPSARKRVGIEPSPRVSVPLGTVPDTPPYTSSEAGSTSSIDLPNLHASLNKFPATGTMDGTPAIGEGRTRPHGQGHRRFSGFAISTITEETPTVIYATPGDRSRKSSGADMDTINELNKSRLEGLEKRRSLLLEVQQSQVHFPGKIDAEELEEDEESDHELPTTKEAILNFLAKSQSKFKPRTDLPTRTRTRSRTSSRPSPYPLPEWQQAESHAIPPLPELADLKPPSAQSSNLPGSVLSIPTETAVAGWNAQRINFDRASATRQERSTSTGAQWGTPYRPRTL